MTHASTFSGIGGPEVAAAMLGWDNLFHCEINSFPRSVLQYWFPDSISYEDITKTDFSQWCGQVDVLTGGFPCQPFSYAGKRRGSQDDRYLWPFMLRCIEQVRPTWFVGENVAGINTMVFPGEDVKVGEQTDLFGEGDEFYEKHERYVLHEIIQNLERAGYSVQPFVIPACAVGAPHRRDRVFIVARRCDRGDDRGGSSESNAQYDARRSCEHASSGRTEMQNDAPRTTQSERRVASVPTESRQSSMEDARLIPDPSCSGSGAQAESDRLISEWRDRLSQQSERRDTTERTDGLSAVSGHPAHTESDGRRCLQPDSSATQPMGTPQRMPGYTHRPCGQQPAPNTTSKRRREVYEQVQSKLADGEEPFGNGREWTSADTESEQGDGLRLEQRESCKPQSCQFGGGSGKDGSERYSTNTIPQNTLHSGQLHGCDEEQGSERNIGNIGTRGSERLCSGTQRLADAEGLLPENRWRTFPSVSPVYRRNDGLPFHVDHLTIPFSEWKRESLKAYGNAIVPQVMYEIFRAIQQIENIKQHTL